MAQQPPSPPIAPDTWQIIDRLVDDVGDLASEHSSRETFYAAVLDVALRVLPAQTGVVWVLRHEGTLDRLCDVGDWGEGHSSTVAEHRRLAESALATRQPTFAQIDGQEALFCPVIHADSIAAIVEIAGWAPTTPQVRDNHVQVLQAICELATGFHHRRTLEELERSRRESRDFEEFVNRLHQSLDLDVTAYALANDGRILAGCDRVSVVMIRGARCQIQAVSAVDTVDRRSRWARQLVQLARPCAAQGDPVWYHGVVDELPPQLQASLHAFLDVSHARRLGLLPLRTRAIQSDAETDGDERNRGHVFAVLVGEDFDARRESDDFERALVHIARPGSVALNNAVDYRCVPFLATFAKIARLRRFFQAGRLPKTLLVLVALAVAIVTLFLVPADFSVPARGSIQPATMSRIFSPEDATVHDVLIQHAQQVTQGQRLLQLRKPELELKLAEVVGDLQAAQQQLRDARVKRFQTGQSAASRDEVNRLAADITSHSERVANLLEMRELLEQRRKALTIRSPIKGQVMTWDVAKRLAARPVVRGAELLTVAAVDGPWQLVMEVSDRDVQKLLEARRRASDALSVSYRMATHPQQSYRGQVMQIAARSQLAQDSNQPSVTVTVEIDAGDLQTLRPGAEAVARIACGRRPLGYVWFHDVWETVQLYVLF